MSWLRALTLPVALAAYLALGPWVLPLLAVLLLVPQVRRAARPTWQVVAVWVSAIAAAVSISIVLPDGYLPIPPGGGLLVTPSYDGKRATARPIDLDVPQHPGLAPNGRSSMHGDAWATDSYSWPGPLGNDPEVDSAWYGLEECATLAFDSHDRLVGLCGNRSGPVLHVIDPRSMRPLDTLDLPDRRDSDKQPWEDLCGGAYFYLDDRDEAVVATTDRQLLTASTADGSGAADLATVSTYDLSPVIPEDDCLVALMADWSGRTWWVTEDARVGIADARGEQQVLQLDGEVANSMAADEDGVYVVTTEALYKLRVDAQRTPEIIWRASYDNGEEQKPGQLSAGSGTTPTVLPGGLVAITDNAEPRMHVQFYDADDGGMVCQSAVFGTDESASDNSLVAVGEASVVVENNYGYAGPWSTALGRAPTGGLARVDAGQGDCSVAWTTDEIAPTSVAKVSLATGLVYAVTTRPSRWGVSAWYLTAIDARTGRTAFSVRTGTGTMYNNHYSAVTLGPDGSAYVPTLAGMVRVTDRD